MWFRFLTAAAVTGLIAGCSPAVTSIHPLHTVETLVDDDGIPGVWISDDPHVHMLVTRTRPGVFNVSFTWHTEEEGQRPWSLALTGHLVQLDEHRFVNLTLSEEEQERIVREYIVFAAPMHLPARIDREGDVMRVRFPDPDRLSELLETGALELAHTTGENQRLILTASSAELQGFFTMHGDHAELFPPDDWILELRRLAQE
jgi:hypothetical protein